MLRDYLLVRKGDVMQLMMQKKTIICADVQNLKMFILNCKKMKEIEGLIEKDNIIFLTKG